MNATATLQRETRLLSVSGAWVRGTWIDDAVLTHCQRSAAAGFGFRVRSPQVGRALVDAGLAVADAGDPQLLTGTRLAERIVAAPTPARPAAASAGSAPRRAAQEQAFLGYCASSHHARPVEAEVRGRRQRGAHAGAGVEEVALCERCASMLGDAGFFSVC